MPSNPLSFDEIRRLLQTGNAAARADAYRLLVSLLDYQVQDETSMFVGQFPWGPDRAVNDLNVALFRLPMLIELLAQPDLPPALAEHLDRAVRLALLGAQRRWDEEIFDLHRDHKAYTNIFLLYVQALLLGGRHYGDERLTRCALAQWQRWYSHIAYDGIDEFIGSYFDSVDFDALRTIRTVALNDRMREQATRALDHLATIQHAVTHPRLKLPVCGRSRDKRVCLTPGDQEGRSILAGTGVALDNRFSGGIPATAYRPPSAIVDAYRNRRFPYAASGRATNVPFLYQSWQDEHAALGSMTGGNYFWQQIHCMAVVGESPSQREVLFMPGAYTIANGYVRQSANRALCLFSRRPNTYLRTQKFATDKELTNAFGSYGVGLSDGWTIDSTESRLTLTAYGQRVTIDPFVLKGQTVKPVTLTPVRRDSLSQGRFHATTADLLEYLFPDDAEWFGCCLQLMASPTLTPALSQRERENGRVGNKPFSCFSGQNCGDKSLTGAEFPAPAAVRVTCRKRDGVLTVREAGGLRICLALQPAGGETELYETDWRTLPLLACPERTVWPGDLAAPEKV